LFAQYVGAIFAFRNLVDVELVGVVPKQTPDTLA